MSRKINRSLTNESLQTRTRLLEFRKARIRLRRECQHFHILTSSERNEKNVFTRTPDSPHPSLCCLGLNEKGKGNDAFIDLLPGNSRLDKIRQEKLKRFRESIASKLLPSDNDDLKGEDHRAVFNLPWKDNGGFPFDDTDHQRYLRTLNAAIFLRIKSLCERQIEFSVSHQLNAPEQSLYNETLVHLVHYNNLCSHTCLGLENFLEKNSSLKQWLAVAQTEEHYPLMITGSRASGKTLLCTRLVQHLLNSLGKTTQCIVRYVNLTSKSRHIVELFSSICTQMNALQHAPTMTSEQQFNRIEYYQSVLKNLSNNQKPLIIMIDGIEDAASTSQYTSSFAYYSALIQLLPPKVNMRRREKSLPCSSEDKGNE